MITLTERAVVRARMLQDRQAGLRGKALRVWVANKDCDGLIFGVAFDHPIVGDQRFEFGSLPVLVDQDTARYISGATVDYIDDERGQGFVVELPSPERFQGKFYLKLP